MDRLHVVEGRNYVLKDRTEENFPELITEKSREIKYERQITRNGDKKGKSQHDRKICKIMNKENVEEKIF